MLPIVVGVMVALAYLFGTREGSHDTKKEIEDRIYKLSNEHQAKEIERLNRQIEWERNNRII